MKQSHSNPTLNPFIYQSISHHFNIRLFFRQLGLHLLLPFSLWLSPNPRAQNLDGTNLLSIIFSYILPGTVYLMIVSYILMPARTQLAGSQWYPLLFYFLHRCTIAVKYASLSREEYISYMSNTDPEVKRQYDQQLLMLSAWGRSEVQR